MQINLNLNKVKKSDLSLLEYLLLQVLYLKPDIDVRDSPQDFLELLENKGYLRIIENDIIISAKARSLFETEVDDKGKEILDYFNKLKSDYKLSNRKTSYSAVGSNIRARLLENPNDSIEDIKNMLDYKFKEWYNNPDMRRYLRIETLFNKTKYQSYMDTSEYSKEETEIRQSKMV